MTGIETQRFVNIKQITNSTDEMESILHYNESLPSVTIISLKLRPAFRAEQLSNSYVKFIIIPRRDVKILKNYLPCFYKKNFF